MMTPTNERPRGQGGADFEHKGNHAVRAAHALYGPRHANAPHRQRPPYGREVEAELAAGRHPDVRLYACPNPWAMAKRRRQDYGPGTVLVLPPEGEPEAYRWPPIRDLVGNVTGLPSEILSRLARALVRDGIRTAYLLDAEHPERNLRVKAVQS